MEVLSCKFFNFCSILTTLIYAHKSLRSAGSNPNADVSTRKYATEYRVEYFQPPYMSMQRPRYTGMPQNINYGQAFTIAVSNPGKATTFTGMSLQILTGQGENGNSDTDCLVILAAIMDLGFHTHAVSLDSKYVGLASKYHSATGKLTIIGRE
jgi:hypothetical protein